ncbi:MAG: hypothetical protein R2753_15150 [Chitinophagales bacterium]
MCNFSCKKEDSFKQIIAFKYNLNESEIAKINLEENRIEAYPIDCFILNTIVLINNDSEVLYAGCDSNLYILNTRTFELNRVIKLPFLISDAYYHQPTESIVAFTQIDSNNFNHLVTINLKSEEVVEDHLIATEIDDGYLVCSSILDNANNYYIVNSDSILLKYNIFDGQLQNSLQLPFVLYNSVYDQIENDLIGTFYDFDINRNIIALIDLDSFRIKRTVPLDPATDNIYLCATDFESKSGLYVFVKFIDETKSQILYIDYNTGLATDSFEIDYAFNHIELFTN